MDKKLALFPVSRNMCAVARHAVLLDGWVLSHLFSPSFLRLDGADISKIDGGSMSNIYISEYGKDKLADCDALFIEYDENIKNLDLYKEVLSDAEELGKEVMLSDTLLKKLEKSIDGLPLEYLDSLDPTTNQLFDIQIPVITVLTQGLRTDQFAFELALRKHFTQEGYKVGQIGSHECSQLFNFSCIPSFMHKEMGAYEKVIRFNRYAKNLVETEKPDLLIIGVPDAIMRYSNKILQGLGLLPFIINSAVKGDLAVLCMYYKALNKEFFENMRLFGHYRLGVPIDFYGFANTSATSDPSSDDKKMSYLNLDSASIVESMNDEVDSAENYLFNILDDESVKKACIAIQEALVNHVHYMR